MVQIWWFYFNFLKYSEFRSFKKKDSFVDVAGPFFPNNGKNCLGKNSRQKQKKEKKCSVWCQCRLLIKINLICCVTNLYNWLAKHITFYNTNVFHYISNVLFCFHCRSWRWVGSMRQVGWNLHLIFWGKYVWGRLF